MKSKNEKKKRENLHSTVCEEGVACLAVKNPNFVCNGSMGGIWIWREEMELTGEIGEMSEGVWHGR